MTLQPRTIWAVTGRIATELAVDGATGEARTIVEDEGLARDAAANMVTSGSFTEVGLFRAVWEPVDFGDAVEERQAFLAAQALEEPTFALEPDTGEAAVGQRP